MNTKVVVAVVAVVILVSGGITAVVLLQGNNNKDPEQFKMDDAKLKVLGNANGDDKIDQTDVDLIEDCINKGKEVGDYPMADANNDKVIDSADVDVVKKIIGGESTTIWHVNYHDSDGDGVMDIEVVSTKFPVTSTIICGSANIAMACYLTGIVSEVKGASYSSTSLDVTLYKDTFRDTDKVTCLNTASATEIAIDESGNIGSSGTISASNVTCLIADWNRTYIPNEKNFEAAHVDVVRISAASFEPEIYTHSYLLLGLLFQKQETAAKVVSLYNSAYDSINDVVSSLSAKKKAVASSSAGSVSSESSDYTAILEAAGAEFGLKGYDFGGAASINVAANLGIYDTTKYNFDYVIHIRTKLGYGSSVSDWAKDWHDYTNGFVRWEKSSTGQFLVSGVVPIPVRACYAAYAMYGEDNDSLSLAWADGIHSEFIKLYPGELNKMTLAGKLFVCKQNPGTKIICQAIEKENVSYCYADGKWWGVYGVGVQHSMQVITVDEGAVIKYGTTEGVYDLDECPSYEAKGAHKVYWKATCAGKDDETGNFTINIGDAMTYTVTGYTGTVDGSAHGLTITVTDPADAAIKYGDSAYNAKSKGVDSLTYKDAGEYRIYYKITKSGYVTVEGYDTVTLTAAAAA